jgi:hypothetical protein
VGQAGRPRRVKLRSRSTVYGNYIEGIEEDYWDILNYFGRDYIEVKKKPLAFYKNISCESLCESQGTESCNTLIAR